MATIGELLNMKFNKASKTQTLSGSNTTVATPLFRITGVVNVTQLYAVVTTALGSNVTAAYYRLNDQTAQVDITLATGSTLSSFEAGSLINKKALSGSAVSVRRANAGVVNEGATAGVDVLSPFMVVEKPTANTDIEFVYTTTNTPTSGVIQHFVEWQPLSEGSFLSVI